jgi:hypothetical protein
MPAATALGLAAWRQRNRHGLGYAHAPMVRCFTRLGQGRIAA